MTKKKEEDYYPEISKYFSEQIQANLDCFHDVKLKVYFAHSCTLKKGLSKIIDDNSLSIPSLSHFFDNVPPLFLDIFGIVTDGTDFELIILEIKLLPSVGLTELSQLVGYSMVSSSTYGFLINVNGRPSEYLTEILSTNTDITDIVTTYDGKEQHHYFNVMEWDSDSKGLRYTTYGRICTLGILCQCLHDDFVRIQVSHVLPCY